MTTQPTTVPARPRIVMADAHTAVIKELQALLEPEFEVVGMVGDGLALVAAVEKLKPDLMVCDVALPLMDGVTAAREIRKKGSGVPVVFVTVLTEPEVRRHALAVAAAFVSKASAGDELVPAVRAALARKREPPAGTE